MIPLVAVAALTVPVVVNRVGLANRAEETVRTVQIGGRIGSLVQDLQQERLLSIGYLFGTVDRSRLILQDATIIDRIADIRADLPELPAELRTAIDAVAKLATVRGTVLSRAATPQQVMSAYGALSLELIDALGLVDRADVATPEGRQIVALDAALRLDDAIGTGAAHMLIMAGTQSPQAATQYAMSLVLAQDNAARFRRFATIDQFALYELVEESLTERLGAGFLSQSPDSVDVPTSQSLAGLTVATLFPSLESLITLGRFVERKIVIDVTVEVTERQRQILLTAYAVAVLALLVLLAVILLSLLVARSVAQPLSRLTASANRVARVTEAELVRVADDESESSEPVRLDPVEITANDEIGDLARAFDRVQTTAARLVERQVQSRRNVAQMFGHVGRRTQNLVSRQLAIIDRLEREETDARRLQHLYRLDHLSSRLRRNAGSLVVLSGATGAEEHMSPLPVADVIRLALGEIEDYTRVDVQAPVGHALAPMVIADVVLLLAEVMENATVFSPPHTRVGITAAPTEQGLRITVLDRGLGLSAERLAEENARLTRRERLDLVPTELLGLFVVGRLARRHGLDVTLSETPGGGVTVTVDLDADLLVGQHEPAALTAVASPLRTPTPSDATPDRPVTGGPVAIGPATGGPLPIGPAAGGPLPIGPVAGGLAHRPRVERAVARASVVSAAMDTAGFNASALHRATRSIDLGQPWNAFAPRQSPTPTPTDGPPSTPMPATVPTAAPTPPAATPAPPAALDPVSPAAPGDTQRPPLRQRVPGAQHPVGSGQSVTAAPTPADPAAARALLEEFEAGVRRAQRLVTGGPAPSAAPRLTQRVPGATLPEPPPRPTGTATGQPWPPDPETARQSYEQFETGVQRALREIDTDHQLEEGSRG